VVPQSMHASWSRAHRIGPACPGFLCPRAIKEGMISEVSALAPLVADDSPLDRSSLEHHATERYFSWSLATRQGRIAPERHSF
jgi:hypothetical protein